MRVTLGHRVKAVVGSLLSLWSFSCIQVPVGDVRMDNHKIEAGEATSVRAEIEIGAGELRVGGGAKALLDADFIYNVPRWKPELTYKTTDKEGHLQIRQPSVQGIPHGDFKYEWNLAFNNDLPMELRIALGAGKSSLQLGDLSLSDLEIETGVGETTVDLNGEWHQDLSARIKGGIGQLNLRLPSDTGVRVDAEKGIGQIRVEGLREDGNIFVNDALGVSKATLRIRVQAGIGEIRLECK